MFCNSTKIDFDAEQVRLAAGNAVHFLSKITDFLLTTANMFAIIIKLLNKCFGYIRRFVYANFCNGGK